VSHAIVFMTTSIRFFRLSLSLSVTLGCLAMTSVAVAGGTKTHDIHGFDELSEGEVEGAAIETSGRVTHGYASEHTKLELSSAFTCLVDGKQAWIGTADKASIQKVDLRGGKPAVEQLAVLEGVVVSAMARLPGGDLVVAVLPGGKLLRVDGKGKVSDFAELKEVEQIWAIVPHKGRLLIGTGPKGELWSVGTDGKDAKIVLDVPEKDILSVLAVGDEVLVGTSPKSRLYKLDSKLEGVLLHEFQADEVRAMVLSGSTLVAAVNEFEDRSISSRTALTSQLNRASLTGEKPEDNNTSRPQADADAELYAVDLGQKRDVLRAQDAAWELWFAKKGQYFIDLLALDDQGTVLAASSEGGRIYRAHGRRDVAVVADLEERQATSLCATDSGIVLATASDGAAVYALSQQSPTKARWVSEVLDADHPARYGNFALRGSGSLELRVRTGPSREVDDRWSAWTPIKLTRDGLDLRGSADIPHRRYMQVEVTLADADAELRSLTAFYAPENLAPLVAKIDVKAPNVSATSDDEPDGAIDVEWEVEARDSDELLYDAYIRSSSIGSGGGGDDEWVKLNTDGPLNKKQLSLDLDTLADGIYEVRVVASDEPSNGSGSAALDELVSDPFVIDRTRPTLEGVKVDGDRVTGIAKDRGSRVHDVAFAIDGGKFRAASPSDGLFDSGTEKFELQLPADLGPGTHRVVVRARDASGNLETFALTVPARTR
jgi:hypothetical protein